MKSKVLECCRIGKQRKRILGGLKGVGRNNPDGDVDRRKRMELDKKEFIEGLCVRRTESDKNE